VFEVRRKTIKRPVEGLNRGMSLFSRHPFGYLHLLFPPRQPRLDGLSKLAEVQRVLRDVQFLPTGKRAVVWLWLLCRCSAVRAEACGGRKPLLAVWAIAWVMLLARVVTHDSSMLPCPNPEYRIIVIIA
jgi:hypothetical protein